MTTSRGYYTASRVPAACSPQVLKAAVTFYSTARSSSVVACNDSQEIGVRTRKGL
jgi:hypothetical protein